MSQSFEVYKASAGSGKTTTLVKKYIELLLNNRINFREIQAVTFTKKATAEMKERILKQLNNPTDNELKKIPKEQLKGILRSILRDYSAFRIKTIDSFFQEVLRNFARELNLPSSYRIELQDDALLIDAISMMLCDLSDRGATNPSPSDDLLKALQDLIDHQIAENKSEDIAKELFKLGKELLYEENIKILDNIETIENLKQELNSIKDKCTEDYTKLKKRYSNLGEINYKGFRGKQNYCYKIFESNDDLKLIHIIDKDWYSNKGFQNLINYVEDINNYKGEKSPIPENEELRCLLKEFLYLLKKYTSVLILQRYLPHYNLLSNVHNYLEKLKTKRNTLLISDTTRLINKILKDSNEIPFIYERIGTRINHHMIDEFQDTSRLQFENFKPLLLESISQGKMSLIVGDAKQSIYRFRNTDSTILTKIKEDINFQNCTVYNLDSNYRSTRSIIKFNNAIYPILSKQIQQLLPNISEDRLNLFSEFSEDNVLQDDTPAKEEGRVVINRICIDNNSDQEEDSINNEENIRQKSFIDTIIKLQTQENAFKPSDICILVRTNKDVQKVAEILMAADQENIPKTVSFDFESAEALSISACPLTIVVINILRFLSRRAYTCNKQTMIDSLLSLRKDNDMQFDQESFVEKVTQLSGLSLYECIQSIFDLFTEYQLDISPSYMPYQLKLLDIAYKLSHEISANIDVFLKKWDDGLWDTRIELPPNEQAIKIMTIHKSKGLAFPVVLLPMLDFNIVKIDGRKFIWTQIPNELGLSEKYKDIKLPITISSKLQGTFFANYYISEDYRSRIDALNLLYVATTRPQKELHIWISNKNDTTELKSSTTIEDILNRVIDDNTNNNLYILNELGPSSTIDNIVSSISPSINETQSYSLVGEVIIKSIVTSPVDNRLAILRKGLSYFKENSQLKMGKLLHRLLSEVYCCDDIDKQINIYKEDGLISPKDAEDLYTVIMNVIRQYTEIAKCFDGSGYILREDSISDGAEGNIYRPDRVVLYPDTKEAIVIDFKFGEERSKYKPQVQKYMNLIKEMGYTNVYGYLWYVPKERIVKVL